MATILKARGNFHINIPSQATTMLSSEMDSRSVKILSRRKIFPIQVSGWELPCRMHVIGKKLR